MLNTVHSRTTRRSKNLHFVNFIKSNENTLVLCHQQGQIQDFKLGGAHVKKLRRVEGGANIFGVFRVKNHDFTPKNHIFPMAEGGAKIVGVFRVKNRDFTPKNHIFFQF